MPTRRTLLQTISVAGAASLFPKPTLTLAHAAPTSRWIGCRKQGDRHFATQFSASGTMLTNTVLPGRGHGIAVSPDARTALVIARRPGTYALLIDLETGHEVTRIESADDRHFYGHACFSTDGDKLFLTENNIRTGDGMVSVRDVQNDLKTLTQFSSGGIGPHELRLMGDGNTLAVANGGILTRPDTGRTALNLETMSPSLVLIDSTTGHIKIKHQLDESLHQLSIRHISVFGERIALALQYEGPKSHHMPLLALYGDAGLRLVETPTPLARAMRNYAGSIAHDVSGQLIAMTCPKANLITYWDANTGEPVGHERQTDICGIAPGTRPGEFIATAEANMLAATLTTLATQGAIANSQWDNHLTRIA